VKIKNDDKLMVSLYVGDLVFMDSSGEIIEEFKKTMKSEFKMTNLGLMSYFFDLEIK